MGEKFDVKGGHFIRRKALLQTKMWNGKQGGTPSLVLCYFNY
jgi:hypothetical protein